MSWILDTDGGLVNLDHVQHIGVYEIEDPQDTATHMLQAHFPDGEGATLCVGDEPKCIRHLGAIASAVHRIKASS